MTFIHLALAWLAGIGAGAFLLAPLTITLAFGMPFAHEMRRKGVLTSSVPAQRYMLSLVILISVFGVTLWAMWRFFPNYIWGYVVGIVLTVLPGLGKCGRTEANVADFFEANARYVDREALARYLAS